MKRSRYVDPRLAPLKAQADEYGMKYREAVWSCAKAKGRFIVLQCFRRTVSRSPLADEELAAHSAEMQVHRRRITELRERLVNVRNALVDLKRELNANETRGA